MFDFHEGVVYPALSPSPADGSTTIVQTEALVCTITYSAETRHAYGGFACSPQTTLRLGTDPNNLDIVIPGWPGVHEYVAGDPAWTFRYDPPGALALNTSYWWQVSVSSRYGYVSGPIWGFTTGSVLAPGLPSNPTPADTGLGGVTPVFTWTSSGSPTYDVYFGTTNPPALVSTGQSDAFYAPSGPLVATTVYFWKVIAHNAGGTTAGPVWRFTARVYAIASAPTLAAIGGTGLNVGGYYYAYTDVTAFGESLPSPLASIAIVAPTNPTTAPSFYTFTSGGAQTAGWFGYAITWTTAFGETLAGPVLTQNVNSAGNGVLLFDLERGGSGVTNRRLYRTTVQASSGAAASAQLKLLATLDNSTVYTIGSPYTDLASDASLGVNVPTSNTTGLNQVAVSGIAAGIAPTTSRKLYRSVVSGAQLKLLTTIANNTTTTFLDTIADGSLGANAPTTDTSGL